MNTAEWISFIGVIVGFPAGIVSVLILLKKDKKREAELKNFEKIANESAKQTKYLAEQVKEMQKDNNFKAEQIKKATTEEKKRKEQIKPYFKIEGNTPGVDLKLNIASLTLINNGEYAQLREYEENEENNVKVVLLTNKREVDFGGSALLQMGPNNNDSKIINGIISFQICYIDEDGNAYAQKIAGSIKKGNIQIHPPIEVI